MTRRVWRESWIGQVTAVVGLLIVVVGLCLFHFEHHGISGNGMCPDPCGVMVSSLALVLLAGPLVSRHVPSDPFRSVYGVSPALLDPPPKAFSLA